MISIEHLTKRFGRAIAVNDVSLTINAGEAVALWGQNGAGKTTIIRCVLGAFRYQGRIRIAGLDAWKQGKLARRLIGYVPQELGFQDELRVGEAVRFFGRLRGLQVDDIQPVLERVRLGADQHKRVRELSGGMKQRLALAIALLGEPPVLVLDEVTASLDACGRAQFISLLSSLARSSSRAILFASHRPEEIEALATRVVTLDRGVKTGDLPAAQFIAARQQQTLLHVQLDPSRIGAAIELLNASGFAAHRNGRGIYVVAERTRRAEALHRLEAAAIRVEDFDIVARAADREVPQ
ncbi:ABC transporter ATP-binding protein [Fontivita pretiosa]|uniref:ABC transporter ATP-binding protein n=1 Tax=Fontivita pretiosa TaxID=2989684 RepID=UPI003D174D66